MKCEPSVFSMTKRRPVCICCSADGSHYPHRTYAPGLFVLHKLLGCIMGYVYFIEAMGQNLFKIGKTRNISQRFERISNACPHKIRMFGYIESSKYSEIERALHRVFSNHRQMTALGNYNEWFALTQDVVADTIYRHGGTQLVRIDKIEKQHKTYQYYDASKDAKLPYHFGVFAVCSLAVTICLWSDWSHDTNMMVISMASSPMLFVGFRLSYFMLRDFIYSVIKHGH